LATLGIADALRAQDLEPRSYTNVPVGETFLLVAAARSDGDLTPVPGSILDQAELTIDTGIVGIAHTFALAGNSAKAGAAAGRGCYEGSAVFLGEFVEGRRCEYLDPQLSFSWNFYGAPALKLEEFVGWQPGVVVGASLQLSVPAGTYNPENLLNAGANRWMVRPGIGMSHRIGRWSYDIMLSVRLFEDNDDFFNGQLREQDPLWNSQAHLIYRFDRGRWLSLNANWFWGGQTTVEGQKLDDRMENSRWGMTYSMPLTPHHTVKLYANTGVVTRVGNEFDTYGIAWQYRF
jgi:hypothetical protein